MTQSSSYKYNDLVLPETPEIRHHLTANMDRKKKDIILANFLGGLAWGFGSVVGATIVVAILLSLLQVVNVVPFIGDFVSGIVEVVNQNQKFR